MVIMWFKNRTLSLTIGFILLCLTLLIAVPGQVNAQYSEIDKSQPAGIQSFDYEGKLQRCNDMIRSGKYNEFIESAEVRFCNDQLSGTDSDYADSCEANNSKLPGSCAFLQSVDSILYATVEQNCAKDDKGERGFLKRYLAIDFSESGGQNNNSGQGLGDCAEALYLAKDMKGMWQSMRNLTNALFVILFVIAILGHVTGAVEAYTAKKIIPRIVIAAVLTQLSWFISTELSGIFDDFGQGISALAQSTFGTENVCFSSLLAGGQCSEAREVGLTAMAGITGYSMGGLLIAVVAIPILAAIVGALFTSYLRVVILMTLILGSPIAMALWALPNTEKWARKWLGAYIKMLAIYPAAAAIIEVAKAAAIAIQPNDMFGWHRLFAYLASMVIYIAGYAFIPLSLRAVSRTAGAITGMANDPAKGLFDRSKNYMQDMHKKNRGIEKEDRLTRRGQMPNNILKSDLKKTKKAQYLLKSAWLQRDTGTAFTKFNREQRNQKTEEAFDSQIKKALLQSESQDAAGRQIQANQNLSIRINALIDDIRAKRDASRTAGARAPATLTDEETAILEQIDIITSKRGLKRNRAIGRASQLAEGIIGQGSMYGGQLSAAEALERGYERYAGENQEVYEDNVTYFDSEGKARAAEYLIPIPEPDRGPGIDENITETPEGERLLAVNVEKPYSIINPDDRISRRKVATLEASPGDTVDWHGKPEKVTPQQQIAAASSLLRLHSSRQDSMEGLREWVHKPQTASNSGNRGVMSQSMATHKFVDDNLSSILSKSPQILYSDKRAFATANYERALNVSGGGLKDLFSPSGIHSTGIDGKYTSDDADAKVFTSFMRQYLAAASSKSQHGKIQQSLVKDIITQAKQRNTDTTTSSEFHINDDQIKILKEVFDEKTGRMLMSYSETQQLLDAGGRWSHFQ